MYDADDKTISNIFNLTKKIMLALKKAMKCDYVQVWISGEEIPHFHIHLLPRYLKDNLPDPIRKKYQEGEPEKILKKIIQEL
jgi:diadenosine tetraphosphate (Ap4A) HIT family hydrolase